MKRVAFEIPDYYIPIVSSPIRNKMDLLNMLAKTIQLMSYTEIQDESNLSPSKKIVLYIDKMSRLFFCLQDKIFSFQFPFHVHIDEESSALSFTYNSSVAIDSMLGSLLVAIFSHESSPIGTFEQIDERIKQEIEENEWEGIDYSEVCELVKHLIMIEPGYFRYDYDPQHANGLIHPQSHIDIFYSSNCTLKLGLDEPISSDWIIDLSNILSDCKFLRT